jgi:hypothetical protein
MPAYPNHAPTPSHLGAAGRGTPQHLRTCVLCGARACLVHGSSDPAATGTYPPWYCDRCWTLGQPYRQTMQRIQAEAARALSRAGQAWYEAAVAARQEDEA